MYFRYFVNISPWKRAWSFLWTTLITFIQWCLMSCMVEVGLVVLEKKIFKFRQCILVISSISPLGKKRGSLFEQTWILVRLLCAEFGWLWPKGSYLYIYVHAIDCFNLINIALGAILEGFHFCFDHSLRQSARYIGVEKQLYKK